MSVNQDESGRRPPTIEATANHRLNQPAERVYDAWLDPHKVRLWMASALQSVGLAGEIKRVEVDPRAGGTFCFSDLRNGSEAVHWGKYLELDRPRRIVFTWNAGENVVNVTTELEPSRVTLAIEPEGDGCLVTIVHEMDAKWAEYARRTSEGWACMLRAIDRLFAEET